MCEEYSDPTRESVEIQSTCDPSLTTNDPQQRKSRLTFMREDQKWESPLFDSTCTRALEPRYLNITACVCRFELVNDRTKWAVLLEATINRLSVHSYSDLSSEINNR